VFTTKMSASNGNASDDKIAAFQARQAITLPDDYKQFLRETNGGIVAKQKFDFIEGRRKTDSRATKFYGVDLGPYDDIDFQLSLVEGRIPEETIPVAHDDLGNLVCLVVLGKSVGQVFFWDHEKESGGRPTYKNMYKIADSFTAFIEHLY
jgi:hypothetical protein